MTDDIRNAGPIVLFDGHCKFCNFWASFLLGADTKGKLKFATLQSKAGSQLLRESGIESSSFDSVVLVHRNQIETKSTAVLRLLRLLGGIWIVPYVLIVIPRSIRDLVYDFVAKNRYRWFGRREVCRIPTAEERRRFLD